MEITRELLKKLAKQSRIDIQPEEEELILERLNNIVEWVRKLDELDLEGVEPLRVMTFEDLATRKDIAKNTIDLIDVLKVAPTIQDNHFVVPKVIE